MRWFQPPPKVTGCFKTKCALTLSPFLWLHQFILAEQPLRNEKNHEGLGFYQIMSVNKVSWLRIWFNWNNLKCPEILNRVKMGNTNFPILVNRYSLSIYLESALKVFKHFNSLGFWSLGVGFRCFNISWSLS